PLFLRLHGVLLGAKWDCQAHDQSAAVNVIQLEAVRRAVKLLQTRTRVGQADAFFDRLAMVGRQAHAVVANLKLQFVAGAAGANLYQPGGRARRDAVTDGVFDQRLQDQIGRARVERLRLDLHFHLQAVAEPRLFDL